MGTKCSGEAVFSKSMNIQRAEVNGIWFYNAEESEGVANLFNKILTTHPKEPSNMTAPSNKSEFQEYDLVSLITESPVESYSAAATTTDAVGGSVSKIFFNAPKFMNQPTHNLHISHKKMESSTTKPA